MGLVQCESVPQRANSRIQLLSVNVIKDHRSESKVFAQLGL